MIHHISLPAKNPRHVANVLSELWGGRAYPFPPSPGSYVVFENSNNQGICIEVYPIGTELIPGTKDEQVQVQRQNIPSQFCEVHAAISVPVSWEQIKAIAKREQWRVVRCVRGASSEETHAPSGFEIVELWVENRFLLELLTAEMLLQYNAFMTPQNWEKFFELELLFDASSKSFAYKSRL